MSRAERQEAIRTLDRAAALAERRYQILFDDLLKGGYPWGPEGKQIPGFKERRETYHQCMVGMLGGPVGVIAASLDPEVLWEMYRAFTDTSTLLGLRGEDTLYLHPVSTYSSIVRLAKTYLVTEEISE